MNRRQKKKLAKRRAAVESITTLPDAVKVLASAIEAFIPHMIECVETVKQIVDDCADRAAGMSDEEFAAFLSDMPVEMQMDAIRLRAIGAFRKGQKDGQALRRA